MRIVRIGRVSMPNACDVIRVRGQVLSKKASTSHCCFPVVMPVCMFCGMIELMRFESGTFVSFKLVSEQS